MLRAKKTLREAGFAISNHELLIGEKSIYGPYNEENDNRLNAMALNAASIRNVSPLLRCSSLAAA